MTTSTPNVSLAKTITQLPATTGLAADDLFPCVALSANQTRKITLRNLALELSRTFIRPTSPSNPRNGDSWIDTSFNPPVRKVWTGAAWHIDSYQPHFTILTNAGPTAPAAVTGLFHWDTVNKRLRIADSGNWLRPDPDALTQASGDARYARTTAVPNQTLNTGSSARFDNTTLAKYLAISNTSDRSNTNGRIYFFQNAFSFTTSAGLKLYTTTGVAYFTADGRGNLDVRGDVTSRQNAISSDIRLKSSIKAIDSPLSLLSALQGRQYIRRATDREEFGFIAQEVEEVLPQLIGETADGYKAVNYNGMIPVLVEALKETQSRLHKLEARLAVSG